MEKREQADNSLFKQSSKYIINLNAGLVRKATDTGMIYSDTKTMKNLINHPLTSDHWSAKIIRSLERQNHWIIGAPKSLENATRVNRTESKTESKYSENLSLFPQPSLLQSTQSSNFIDYLVTMRQEKATKSPLVPYQEL